MTKKIPKKTIHKKPEFKEELVDEIQQEFRLRREARRNIEQKWLLNINFLLGNQHSYISPGGDIADNGKQYYWQEREAFNHIAPIIEARLSKFTRVNCAVNVRPASSSDTDINIAKLSGRLIEATQLDNNFINLHNTANYWSEVTGTAFYKIVWSKKAGKMLTNCDKDGAVYEGDVKISVCPPYEIYPDTLSATSVSHCRSIIHAKAYPVEAIRDIWGQTIEPEEVSVINTDTVDSGGGFGYAGKSYRVFSEVKRGYAVVIERYEAPTTDYPNGRLHVVAGDKLLFEGELPYENGANGTRGFPFIRQVALEQPQCFYGMSIIERLIPVQRAYNAIKNRKHEFINRLSNGVLAVEDGSVDTDLLEEEGLSPGRVIVYRQGSAPPRLMSAGSVPAEFRDEEDRLLSEFIGISGVNNYLNTNNMNVSNLSGYALSLLVEQDYARLSVTTESIRNAMRELAGHILRLFRQFAKTDRIIKISGDNGDIEIKSFLGSDLSSDDIITEADSELVETPAVRRGMVMDLLKHGLLSDQNGKISNRNKAKILEMLGFGNWENYKSTEEAHIKKSAIENSELLQGKDCGIEEVDDHDIHVEEHTRFLVSGRDSLSKKAKEQANKHIREHKVFKRLIHVAEGGEQE
ncbi:MAG: hypothetical protein FWD49_06675 [Firmicutes bacterium]|nr:hypothetical protein [Bacillota bacterium]